MGSDPLTPDLATTSTVVRKRRAPKHDFRDGHGKVFAHRHDNGGGWVADTAYVAPSVKVTRNAQVFDYAKVYDQCKITGSSYVFGHARLFGEVQLFKNARVHSRAVLGDSVQLYDTAVVCGRARVFGNTQLHKRALINGDSYVCNTYIQGPAYRMDLLITGSARVLDSRLYGYALVTDSSTVDRSTIRNACAISDCKIIDSHLTTDFPWQESCILDRDGTIEQFFRDSTEADVYLRISRRRSSVFGTMLNSTLVSTNVSIGPSILLLNSRMHMRYTDPDMYMSDATEFFRELNRSDNPVAFCNIDMLHDVSGLREYLSNGANAGAQAPGPVTRPGYVPGGQTAPSAASVANLDTIRQRRLQRLEGE